MAAEQLGSAAVIRCESMRHTGVCACVCAYPASPVLREHENVLSVLLIRAASLAVLAPVNAPSLHKSCD